MFPLCFLYVFLMFSLPICFPYVFLMICVCFLYVSLMFPLCFPYYFLLFSLCFPYVFLMFSLGPMCQGRCAGADVLGPMCWGRCAGAHVLGPCARTHVLGSMCWGPCAGAHVLGFPKFGEPQFWAKRPPQAEAHSSFPLGVWVHSVFLVQVWKFDFFKLNPMESRLHFERHSCIRLKEGKSLFFRISPLQWACWHTRILTRRGSCVSFWNPDFPKISKAPPWNRDAGTSVSNYFLRVLPNIVKK